LVVPVALRLATATTTTGAGLLEGNHQEGRGIIYWGK
jgi:hypothetical protein